MDAALRLRAVQDAPAVRVENIPRDFAFPGRTMLFAMVSASTLTGAVANSIGGERSRKTLVVLLSAAISRAEIVAGKALGMWLQRYTTCAEVSDRWVADIVPVNIGTMRAYRVLFD